MVWCDGLCCVVLCCDVLCCVVLQGLSALELEWHAELEMMGVRVMC